MKTSLTAQDLALYLGCIVWDDYNQGYATLTGINIDNEKEPVIITVNTIHPRRLDEVKPVLRRLSSMTEEELREWGSLVGGDEPSNWATVHENLIKIVTKKGIEAFEVTNGEFSKAIIFIDWARSKGFDIQNWIDSGLAIDQATLKTEKE